MLLDLPVLEDINIVKNTRKTIISNFFTQGPLRINREHGATADSIVISARKML
jgi:hypothetical protein